MKKTIQIIIPVYNEESNILRIQEEISSATTDIAYDIEILFINDGSHDNTLGEIKLLAERFDNVSFVDLSRNYGKEVALLAGLDYSRGDAIIMLDGDLQHPPDMIPSFIKEWENGYLDVYGLRVDRAEEPFLLRNSKRAFYKILNRFSRVEHIDGAGDFRLLDRKVVDTLKRYRENKRYTKGLYNIVGFKKKGVPYQVKKRHAGKTKWKLWQLINLGIDGITSFSTAPLRISTLLGGSIALFSFTYLVISIAKTLIWGEPVRGYPTLISVILLLGGIQLISLGIIGEYIGVIFEESKKRPVYNINEYFTKENK